jgi:hypothetical protein
MPERRKSGRNSRHGRCTIKLFLPLATVVSIKNRERLCQLVVPRIPHLVATKRIRLTSSSCTLRLNRCYRNLIGWRAIV